MIRFWCAALAAGVALAAPVPQAGPATTFKQYCYACHGKTAQPMGGVSVEKLSAENSIGENFQHWQRIATALEKNQMPPKGLPQPSDAQRRQAVDWIRTELATYIKKHDGDPGRVTVRRLTSGEYTYSIRDLTGLELNLERELVADEAGGEGFTNFGDVQFIQDAGLERYLEVAKRVADHAVIGAGPLEFFIDPGKSGLELSALARITEIYRTYGFRTVSGEGGRPFGLEKYGKVFYAAWRYRHRAALGEATVTLDALAAREGITGRFARHIWTVLNRPTIGYPISEIAARWRKLPAPGADAKATESAVRAGCEDIQKFTATWPTWLFARGDLAAGGAGDESPLVFSDETLKATPSNRFNYPLGGRGFRRGPAPTGPPKVFISVTPVNPNVKPLVVWRNPMIVTGGFRGRGGADAAAGIPKGGAPAGPQVRKPLREMLSPETVERLGFGRGAAGVEIGPDDFITEGPVLFEVNAPQGGAGLAMQVNAEIAGDRNQVVRITISDREDGGALRGNPARALLGDPASAGYREFKRGVMELADLMPPNSHGEPNPADKDPVPEPFDNTYNTPEHDAFVLKVKYQRNDKFLIDYGLDEAMRTRLQNAWSDLFASFEYFDAYLGMLADHYKYDLKGKGIAAMDAARLATLPEAMRKYVAPLRAEWEAVQKSQAAGQARHIDDVLKFASRAWRRPLTLPEQESLRAFYRKLRAADQDHAKAIRATVARVLVSPAFLYRLEHAPQAVASASALSGWEVASRLSYFLWSSIPDDELRRAASAGELATPAGIRRQVKRMVADPKARRIATEFFGQWLGFYRFDEFRGVDTGRFPEFTDEVKSAMYNEAVSFFEHVVRKDRPLREILHADYTFLNKALAKHYGVNEVASDEMTIVGGAAAMQRGGLLRLGAVLTATSAPLRTSPVKRGDWVLRRVLGTPVPPPPADAGSIPADEKMFGGLSLREKLEAHKRNPTCAGCHTRIDPLGFPLEKYDAVGRWREKYPDGKPVDDAAALADKTEIAGVGGLLGYLSAHQEQVTRTMAQKLVGYALGRTMLASDQPLIERMAAKSTFAELAAEVASSRQFRYRRGEESPATRQTPVAPARQARVSAPWGGTGE